MADREDNKEHSKLSDVLNQLLYEVGSLRFNMRNNAYQMSELLFAPTTVPESKDTETTDSPSEDHKSENLEKENIFNSISDKFVTDAINRCNDSMEEASLSSEHLKILQFIETDLRKKVDEMSHGYEESLSQLINSCKL